MTSDIPNLAKASHPEGLGETQSILRVLSIIFHKSDTFDFPLRLFIKEPLAGVDAKPLVAQ